MTRYLLLKQIEAKAENLKMHAICRNYCEAAYCYSDGRKLNLFRKNSQPSGLVVNLVTH